MCQVRKIVRKVVLSQGAETRTNAFKLVVANVYLVANVQLLAELQLNTCFHTRVE